MIQRQKRPPWVDQVLKDISVLTMKHLDEINVLVQHDLNEVRIVAGPTVVIHDLEQAVHDLAHAYEHFVSIRRALKMTWPDDRDG
jgi:hypothetical protein